MFIQDFVSVPRPFEEIARITESDPSMLVEDCRSAHAAAEALVVRLAPSGKRPWMGKKVDVDLGRPLRRGDALIVPMHWCATGAAALFPRFEGDLEFNPLGVDSVQITLRGVYDPPAGVIGAGLDRMLLNRVAMACLRSFLLRVTERLSYLSPPSPAPPLRAY